MRVSASVSAPHAVEGLVRDRDRAVRRRDRRTPDRGRPAPWHSARRTRRPAPAGRGPARRTRRRPCGRRCLRPRTASSERRTESGQERIAGAVPVGVVVALEAVEVEQHERVWSRVRVALGHLGEIRFQLSPVGQPREWVGQRLHPALAEKSVVLAERQRHPDERQRRAPRRRARARRRSAGAPPHREHTEGNHAERNRQRAARGCFPTGARYRRRPGSRTPPAPGRR